MVSQWEMASFPLMDIRQPYRHMEIVALERRCGRRLAVTEVKFVFPP
jgi:ribosomal protein L13E